MMEVKIGQLQRRKKEPPPSKEPPRKSGQRRDESLAALFRGKIHEREFFERVSPSSDRNDLFIPYWSVIGFYRQEENYLADLGSQHTRALALGRRVFNRKKWAGPACRMREPKGQAS